MPEVICPECGWTGKHEEFKQTDGEYQCPVCAEAVVIVD